MKLSGIFNQPDRAEQLDCLEQALLALEAQKRHLDKGSDQIAKANYGLIQSAMILKRAEAYNHGPLSKDSVGSSSLGDQQKKVKELRTGLARTIAADETAVATAVAAVFKGGTAPEVFNSSAAAKLEKPEVINRQIGAINKLIDDGSLGNTVKRVAWQATRLFTHN
jgi:hypothetical protein